MKLHAHIQVVTIGFLLISMPFARGAETDAKGAPKEYTQAEVAEMINNPLGELWVIFLQNDLTSYDGDVVDALGESDKIFNTTTIMPVLPFQLTENWKYIFRPVITLNSWDLPAGERDFGLGDTVLWNAFANNEMAAPPNITGFGFTAMVPTATDDKFGTGKWSAGPMALALHLGPVGGNIFGVVAQHWWDFAGESDRNSVNLSNIQYLFFHRFTENLNVGFGPNITCDWTAESGQQWTIPVGMGMNTMTKIGKLPVKVGVEAYYYVERPDAFGADYGLRLIFAPVIPKPGFSKTPIF